MIVTPAVVWGTNTLTSPEAFREELARIRVSGIAVNNEELAYGLREQFWNTMSDAEIRARVLAMREAVRPTEWAASA